MHNLHYCYRNICRKLPLKMYTEIRHMLLYCLSMGVSGISFCNNNKYYVAPVFVEAIGGVAVRATNE